MGRDSPMPVALRLRMVSIYVEDQERALRFYTSKLGFDVATDADYGAGGRWLSLTTPGDPSTVELLLEKPDSEQAAALQRSRYEDGKPALSVTTDDCRKVYEMLSEKGVRFTQPPSERSYGGTDAVLDDTCGNLINLHED